MGRINVEGLGVVEIAGDEPTREELNIIKNNYQKIVSEEATSQQANKATDDFITGITDHINGPIRMNNINNDDKVLIVDYENILLL